MAGEDFTSSRSQTLLAGRVGRAHGLDGSFYVTRARPRLLEIGKAVTLDGRTATVARRAGTDEHPIVRLEGIEDRQAAEAVRGLELTVELAQAPELGEGEWWAGELEGCEVFDGERHVGLVVQLVELPSCEALEVRPTPPTGAGSTDTLLLPMVSAAIRAVDVARGRIDVDMSFVEDAL
jgi:16S rRNA processing protein RimM